jgi:glycine/D-amino acid oxidase-like deaminating enzyme
MTAVSAPVTKELRDGRSLWADSPVRRVRTRKLIRADHFDIVIVGAGISGALVALRLAEAGHDVGVVDKRSPGSGSTVASTAMIQFELDTPFVELSDKIGAANAKRAWLRSRRAVSDLGDLIERHDLRVDWMERQALYLAGDTVGFRGLREEAAARQKLGLPSHFLTKAELADRFGIDRTGAILSEGSGELDPAKLTAASLARAVALGATILSPCDVTRVVDSEDCVTLTTADESTITCRRAIFATGYEVIDGLPKSAFDIVSSWAIATQPLPPETFWRDRCLIWEAADPYLYLRSTADNRILVGGEDSGLVQPSRRAAAIPAKAKRLLAKVKGLLGREDLEVDYAWAGAFADSPTGLPVFTSLPGLPNVMGILGCGGNGITFSVIAADIVTAWAKGRRDPDSDLFTGRG